MKILIQKLTDDNYKAFCKFYDATAYAHGDTSEQAVDNLIDFLNLINEVRVLKYEEDVIKNKDEVAQERRKGFKVIENEEE